MIQYCNGDLFEAGAETLVNPVNCVGVMGAGIALEFKRRFPLVFREYRDACFGSRLEPGGILPVRISAEGPFRPRWIVHLATKNDWRTVSRLEWVDEGLRRLSVWLAESPVATIAVPALGCGKGGLLWDKVRRLIERHLGNAAEQRVLVYPPQGRKAEEKAR